MRRAAVVLAALALAAAGCGDDEPEYCSDLGDLEESVNRLGDVDVAAGGTNALRDALRDVESDARSTVDAAKSEFSDETSAISESVDTLKESAQGLAGAPTGEQAATVLSDASAVVTAVDELVDATKSDCQ